MHCFHFIFKSIKIKNHDVYVTLLTSIFQDFYSHSNWIELGNMFAYTTLIRADLNIDNIAGTVTIHE